MEGHESLEHWKGSEERDDYLLSGQKEEDSGELKIGRSGGWELSVGAVGGNR